MTAEKPNIEDEQVVLRAEGIGKCFKIYDNPWHRALEWLTFGRRAYHQPFWAVRDVSFKLKRGEFLAIIGQNGAGKSTLLKILSGILQPTTGSYEVKGRVLSLFGLSMSFNAELSGRDNVYLASEALDLPKNFAREREDEIRQFSELGEFFDRPTKMYSSGMRARLAFSLFSFLGSDILLLDEVLATGDIFFRQKCYARLAELLANKTTIILVTHSIDVVKQFSHRVLLLDKGRELYQGEPSTGIGKYMQIRNSRVQRPKREQPQLPAEPQQRQDPASDAGRSWPQDSAFVHTEPLPTGKAQLVRFAICDAQGNPCSAFSCSEELDLYYELQLRRDVGSTLSWISITDQFKVLIHAKSSLHCKGDHASGGRKGDLIRFHRRIKLDIKPGNYVIGLGLNSLHADGGLLDLSNVERDALESQLEPLYKGEQVGCFKILQAKEHQMTRHFWGMCDLPNQLTSWLVTSEALSPAQDGQRP